MIPAKISFLNQDDIILRLREGDLSIFPDVVNLCKEMVYNTALGIVQHREDAEDITQEVFVKIYNSVDQFKKESKLTTWVYKITVRTALDVEKAKLRQKRGGLWKRIFNPSVEEEPLSFDHPGVKLDNKEDARLLFAAVSKLPEKQKLAFLLHKTEGLDFTEIAQIMDTTKTAVESLQARAKLNLRNWLEKYYEKI